MSSERVVSRTSGYALSIERRLAEGTEWTEFFALPETTSIEYARILMGRIEPVSGTAQHRLVEIRTEIVKRDVS
jgi:hypothetical protein